MRDAAPGLPLFSVKTFAAHVDSSAEYWALTMIALMFGSFGGLALLVALVGIYGVTAYTVSRRTREIGVRIAVGARPRAVLGLIVRESLTTTLAGIAAGLILGIGVGRVMASMFVDLAGVRRLDVLAGAGGFRAGGAGSHVGAGTARDGGQSAERAAQRVAREFTGS